MPISRHWTSISVIFELFKRYSYWNDFKEFQLDYPRSKWISEGAIVHGTKKHIFVKGSTTKPKYEVKHAFDFIKDLTSIDMYDGTRAAILRVKNMKK
jgi:hypothetical protein